VAWGIPGHHPEPTRPRASGRWLHDGPIRINNGGGRRIKAAFASAAAKQKDANAGHERRAGTISQHDRQLQRADSSVVWMIADWR